MKCKWCERTFFRGGPSRAFERLKDHVEDEHRDQVEHLLVEGTEHLPPDYGQAWAPGESA